MPYSTIFFDLDGTLYEHGNGLWEAISKRINRYMQDKLGVEPEKIPRLRQEYFEKYGTTLRGFQLHGEIDAEEYLSYVHDVPLEDYLQPNEEINHLLGQLPQRKWVFTNSDHRHSQRVLEVLGLSECFEGVIDVLRMGYVNKPEKKAYLLAMESAKENDAGRCLMVDDLRQNLAPAGELGMTTVLVGAEAAEKGIDHCIGRLEELGEALPQLLEIEGEPWETGKSS